MSSDREVIVIWVQFKKHLAGIAVTPEGMEVIAIFEQASNDDSPSEVSAEGSSVIASALHPPKARLAIEVTVLGIDVSAIDLFRKKQLSPMLVKGELLKVRVASLW